MNENQMEKEKIEILFYPECHIIGVLDYFPFGKVIPKILPEEHPSADSAVDIALRCCTRCLRLLHSCRLTGDNSGKRHGPEKKTQ